MILLGNGKKGIVSKERGVAIPTHLDRDLVVEAGDRGGLRAETEADLRETSR